MTTRALETIPAGVGSRFTSISMMLLRPSLFAMKTPRQWWMLLIVRMYTAMAMSAITVCHHVVAKANAAMRAAGIIIGMAAPVRRLAQRASQITIFCKCSALAAARALAAADLLRGRCSSIPYDCSGSSIPVSVINRCVLCTKSLAATQRLVCRYASPARVQNRRGDSQRRR